MSLHPPVRDLQPEEKNRWVCLESYEYQGETVIWFRILCSALSSQEKDPKIVKLLFVARIFIHNDMGDKEDSAWEAIVKLVNEKMDLKNQEGCPVLTAKRAKDLYQRLQNENNPHYRFWDFCRSVVDQVTSVEQMHDVDRLEVLFSPVMSPAFWQEAEAGSEH